MAGRDMRRASSMHSFGTFESFLNVAVVDTVEMHYNNPQSEDGKKIHRFLSYLDGEWKLDEVAQQHYDDVDALSRLPQDHVQY